MKLYKKFSQHFISSKNIIKKIIDAAELNKEKDIILEIGAGDGRLTSAILEEASYVITVEIDKRFVNLLAKKFEDVKNLKIINCDILKLNLKELSPIPNKIIANIPYHITGPILNKLFKNKEMFKLMVIMLQEELAKRIMAKVGTSSYGKLTIFVNYHSIPELICKVEKNLFIPQPKVNSAVVRLRMLNKPPVEVLNEKLFFQIIQTAFSKRRKTILNALDGILPKEELKNILNKLNIALTARPQNISLYEYSKLAGYIFHLQSLNP